MAKTRIIELEPAPGVDPDDDSDAALWRTMRYNKQKHRSKTLVAFNDNGYKLLEEVATPFGLEIQQHTEYHLSLIKTLTFKSDRIDYWPSANKWQYRGKIYHGDVVALCGFIRNRFN